MCKLKEILISINEKINKLTILQIILGIFASGSMAIVLIILITPHIKEILGIIALLIFLGLITYERKQVAPSNVLITPAENYRRISELLFAVPQNVFETIGIKNPKSVEELEYIPCYENARNAMIYNYKLYSKKLGENPLTCDEIKNIINVECNRIFYKFQPLFNSDVVGVYVVSVTQNSIGYMLRIMLVTKENVHNVDYLIQKEKMAKQYQKLNSDTDTEDEDF